MDFSRDDYNNRIIDKAGIIPTDEPVFLLRAQDKHTPAALREYALRLRMEGNEKMADAVGEIVLKFIAWQNNKKVKSPSSPQIKLKLW